MYTLTVKSGFSAAHRLADFPGDCKRIHGHNYNVSLSIQALQLDENGMIMDLMQLQTMLDHCIKAFDHQFLNEIEPFIHINPTSEHIARFIFDNMTKHVPEHVSVASVTVQEVDAFSVTYTGE